MTQILMPKATAVWLIDNTSLSFEQIGVFCSLHPLEVQSIADGEAGVGIQGYDPVLNGQITRAELDRCEADETAVLAWQLHICQRQIDEQKGRAMCRWHAAVTNLMRLCGW